MHTTPQTRRPPPHRGRSRPAVRRSGSHPPESPDKPVLLPGGTLWACRAGMSTDRDGQVDQRAQLRLGAAIALTSTLLLLPVQAFSTPRAQLPVLFLVYA